MPQAIYSYGVCVCVCICIYIYIVCVGGVYTHTYGMLYWCTSAPQGSLFQCNI